MNPNKDDVVEEAIARAATEWYVAHRQGELTDPQRGQYLQWLKASPRHIEAYLKVAGMAGKLPEALAAMEIDLEQRLRQAAQVRETAAVVTGLPVRDSGTDGLPTRRRPLLAGGLAVAALGVAGLVAFLAMDRLAGFKTFTTPPDEQRFLTLEDGSMARLDSNTRLRIEYSHTRRLIVLRAGQGLFTVMHDARRPFIVRTAGQDIVALGTQFDVSRRDERVEVTVVQGRVEVVRTRAGEGSTARPAFTAPALELAAGQQIQVSPIGKVSAPKFVDTAATTAWTRKIMSFTDSSLESVAEQFNHHTGARILIEDLDLKGYKVSGVFQAYDLESFIGYLQQLPGVTVTRGPDNEVRVSRNLP